MTQHSFMIWLAHFGHTHHRRGLFAFHVIILKSLTALCNELGRGQKTPLFILPDMQLH